jgi:diguanylate cyclase (GGDEF)-like protein
MSVRLRPVLLVGLLALQAITVIALVIATGRNTEGLLIDAMGRTMLLAVETLDQRTSELLGPAEDAAQLSTDLLVSGVLPVDDDATLLVYLDAQVLSNLSITGAYIGRPDGSFLLVSRDGATIEGGTRVKTITVGPDGRRSVTAQRDADGVTRRRTEDPTDAFDPRQRPWYEAAAGADDIAWTDPYVFFASREPGITTAMAARGDDGQVIAVVGVDLSLRDLSTFVGRMEVGEGSRSILVDQDGYMVATADVTQVNVDDGAGGLRRANIDEVTDPVLTAGVRAARLRVDRASDDETLVVPFEAEGRHWQIAVVPLAARSTWSAAVAAPEDQFVNLVVDAQRENAVLAVLIALAITVLAVPAVLAVSRRVDRIAEHAVTDPVTGVANRRQFDRLLAEHLEKATPANPMCLAVVDVDRFKPINDTWGHNVGDQVLAVIAGRLRGELRDDDVVARIGGDEFAAILVDADIEAAFDVLERVRQTVVGAPALTNKGEIDLSITVGVAQAIGDGADTPAAVLERADRALYAAKQAGRNRIAGPEHEVELGAGPVGPQPVVGVESTRPD